MEYATNNSSHLILLAIELILRIGTLHHLLVRLFQVLGEDDVSVVANRLQTGFLANRRDIGTADLLRTIHKGLQIHLLAQVHLGGTRLEHESLLTSVGSGNSTLRSRRPGRISAGSNISGRLVAMITFTLVV